MTENFLNLVKDINIQIKEVQKSPKHNKPKDILPRHIIIKMQKVTREQQLITYKGAPIRLSADFSTEALQARRDWHEVFKVMKSKDLHPRLLYPAKLSLRL